MTPQANAWGGKESKTVSGFRKDGTAFSHKSHKMAGHREANGHKISARS